MKPGGPKRDGDLPKPAGAPETPPVVQRGAHATRDASPVQAQAPLASELAEALPIASGAPGVKDYDQGGDHPVVTLDSYRDTGKLTRESIVLALQELSDRLGKTGQHGKILLLGGAAMILIHQNREGTKDIDAITDPKSLIYEISEQMAKEHGLPEGWLNDAAKGFVPEQGKADYTTDGVPQFPNLTVFVTSSEMLFAMKALATRVEPQVDEAQSRDLEDLKTLAQFLGVKDTEDARRIISAFYPLNRIPARFWYVLDEILGKEDADEGGHL